MENALSKKSKFRYKSARRIYEIMLMDLALKERQKSTDYQVIANEAVKAADAFIRALYPDQESLYLKNGKE